MWLLRVDCRELKFFHSPEAVEKDGGFAALSHVWDEEEQSFQDVQRIQNMCKRTGLNPRSFVCEKIRRCCELAERHGFKWMWMDMCCIDKTSSAELSEAINSMFRYYALARICYGYLRDITLTRPHNHHYTVYEQEQFRHSVWFSRGWTLQELIAPRFFLFVNGSWEVLGSKADFAELLENGTHIPAAVLRLEVSHSTFSIGQRLSWYGNRETTRVEDEAYCLLGLFNIHMPPLYGEGRKAFRRLQEEIMKQSPDTTLFAWHPWSRITYHAWLFAEQPSDFRFCTDVTYTPPERQHGQGTFEISFSLTPHGVLAHVPVVECGEATYADLYWYRPWDRKLLKLTLDDDDPAASSCPRRLYKVQGSARCTLVAGEYNIGQDTVRASWQDVLIRDSRARPLLRLPGQLLHDARTPFVPAIPIQLALDAPFRFPEHHIREFAHAMGLGYLDMTAVSMHRAKYPLPGQSDSALTTQYVIHSWSMYPIVIELGQCRNVASPTQLPPHDEHAQALPPGPAWSVWARVCYDSSRAGFNEKALDTLPAHDCREHHVSQWPDSKRVFYIPRKKRYQGMLFGPVVTLSFTPCPINQRTLVLDASYHTEDKKYSSIPSDFHPAVDISSFVS